MARVSAEAPGNTAVTATEGGASAIFPALTDQQRILVIFALEHAVLAVARHRVEGVADVQARGDGGSVGA